MYGYYNYYSTPAISSGTIIAIVVAVAAIIGLVLFFTLFRKKNEGRFRGFWGKIYNFFHFSKFYTEDLMKLIYIMSVFAVTCAGIAYIVMGALITGILWIVVGNIALRLVAELIIICMVMVRRLVSIDRKVSKLEKFFEDDYSDWEDRKALDTDEDDEGDDFECNGSCSSCSYDCAPDIKASVIYAGHTEKEKLSAPKDSQAKVSLKKEGEVEEAFEKEEPKKEESDIPKFCKGCEEWDEVSSDCYAEKCIREEKKDQ